MGGVGASGYKADETDLRILQQVLGGNLDFFASGRPSHEAVGEALGLHPDTVAARIRGMEEARFLLPHTYFLNSNRLGFTGGRLFFPMPTLGRSKRIQEKVFRIEGVFGSYDFVDGLEFILFADDDADLDRKALVIRDLVGGAPFEWETKFAADWPAVPRYEITPLDARILGEILSNPRGSPPVWGATLGVTARTVQARAARLRSEGVLHVYAGGTARPNHFVLGYLRLDFASPRDGEAMLPHLKLLLANSFYRVLVPQKPRFCLWAPSVHALVEQCGEAARLPGVQNATFRIIKDYTPNPAYPVWAAKMMQRVLASQDRQGGSSGADVDRLHRPVRLGR